MSFLLGLESNQSSTTHPISISEATEHLEGLAEKKRVLGLKRKQFASERENEDMKQHLFRKKEDLKYNAVLAGRPCEDEQTRQKRKVEDSEINHDEATLEDEIVRICSSFSEAELTKK